MSILIKNGRVIAADKEYAADLLIENETIAAVGPHLKTKAKRTIDASGKYVIPGGVDVHTHMEAPVGSSFSSDDFETGTRAAAFGGTTCIIDFATQSRGERMLDAYRRWRIKAEKSTVDYGLHMIVTDLPESHLDDLNELVREGVTSFKMFMAYPQTLMADDSTIIRAMKRIAAIDALFCVHAEDGMAIDALIDKAKKEGKTEPIYHALTRPPETEGSATRRIIDHARQTGVALYIVHVTCAESVQAISSAQKQRLPVYGETCPHYLLLDIDELRRPGFEGAKYVLTPPLREKNHQPILWQSLKDGTLQIVSTDHCPFFYRGQKDAGKNDFTKIPNGGPGIENRLALMFHYGVIGNKISASRWIDLVATKPAKLFGLYPKKGTIAVGSDADIVVWNPTAMQTISSSTHHMNVDYSMFEGFAVLGVPEFVLSRGEIIVENGNWLGKKGRGKYLKRSVFSGAGR